MATPTPTTVTIDGQQYAMADLSQEARNQLLNVRICDEEIARLRQQLAIAQTARVAYAKALADALPKQQSD
ncbi:DUF6447 family protein [uncultured Thiohalocapsa sp.]|uniref:DUF6447 family protein n=1 Tax=uncultured Thiohalocapsa sp. TaxID=768990 RepID=UPI0025F6E0F9|nr:DUF6447 family protein [uncultured Thiohalocapsa sp.]